MEPMYVTIDGREEALEFFLSVEDSQRARNDPQYLQALVNSRLGESSKKLELESKENPIQNWSHEDTLLLLEAYREKEGAFSYKRHAKVWEDIAAAILSGSNALKVTGRQCQAKISGLKRTYKEVKARKAKSGNGACPWRYLEVMESIFGDKAWVEAPAIAGSEGPPPPTNLSPNAGTSKKRKVEGVLEELLGEWRNERAEREQSREEREAEKRAREERREQEKRKRHEEKLAMQGKMLQMMAEFLKK